MKKAEKIKIPNILIKYALEKDLTSKRISKDLISLSDDITVVKINKKKLDCMEKAPKSIHDLKDGLLFESYSFTNNDSIKLNLLGFSNVDFKKIDKVIVVEYSQTGSIICDNEKLKFGIGARMMMKIKKTGFNAKLDSPYQVSASVIFGKANVTFSVITFGIVGPGTKSLIKSGSLTEDTYTQFINTIANLIVDAYKENSDIVITPQPLFLAN